MTHISSFFLKFPISFVSWPFHHHHILQEKNPGDVLPSLNQGGGAGVGGGSRGVEGGSGGGEKGGGGKGGGGGSGGGGGAQEGDTVSSVVRSGLVIADHLLHRSTPQTKLLVLLIAANIVGTITFY